MCKDNNIQSHNPCISVVIWGYCVSQGRKLCVPLYLWEQIYCGFSFWEYIYPLEEAWIYWFEGSYIRCGFLIYPNIIVVVNFIKVFQ